MLKKIMRMTCLLLTAVLLAGCSQGTAPGGSDGTVEPELSVLSAKILSGRGCIHLEWSIKNSTKETWKVEDKITVLYKDDKGEWVEGGVSKTYAMSSAMLEPKQTRSQTDTVTGVFAAGTEYRIQKYLEKKDTGEGIFLQAAFTAEE